MEPDVLERIFDGSIQPRDVKLSALEIITENFSRDRIIGEGGFGTVYKGVLRNGEVAVKRIKNNLSIDEKLFRREVKSLFKVNHKNVVRFIGFCSHTEHKAFEYEGSGEFVLAEDRERLLCFEYINNGSLEKYIADELRGLQWDTRYAIIKGICEGLQYLHIEKGIMHMDLKPANILIDDNMVAKITDFGLSRMVENSQTKTTNRFLSQGYSAPEYIDSGTMSPKYDVYSLGIIILQLVTGHRSIPDSNNVLRRWRHRWHKSGKETPFKYQQITKLLKTGLVCQEKDPYNRPFISDIISVINELESTDRQISNDKECMVKQISPYPEDDMLGIEPLELHFPFGLNTQTSCSLELTNMTSAFFAFNIQTTSTLPYCIQPSKDIVAPRSKYSVKIILQLLDKAPQDHMYNGDFIVRSTTVNGSLIREDITEDIFEREEGKLVDEVNVTVTYKTEVPQVDVSLGPLIISDTRNLHGPQESNVSPTEIIASIFDEVIQFDPPKLCFPLVPNKKVLSSIKIINITEAYVSFRLSFSEKNTGNYSRNNYASILAPKSTQCLTITMEEMEDAVKDMQFNDEVFVWYAIVAEDIKLSDLDGDDYTEWKKLHIILTMVNSFTSNELIEFNPPVLSFPCLNKTSLSSVNIVNVTDCYVGFNTWTFREKIRFYAEPCQGILPPRSTQRMVVKRVQDGKGPDDMHRENYLFVWSMIVAEGVEANNFRSYKSVQESKNIPLTFNKISTCTSDELIRVDPPGLRFTYLQDKIVLSSVNMVNVTYFYVGFQVFNGDTNAGQYHVNPRFGILAPRSAQRLVVTRLALEKEHEDMQYKEKIFMWNAIVSEGAKDTDLDFYLSSRDKEESNELPITLNKITSSTSLELMKLEPPEVRFPFLWSKTMLSSIKISNITDYHIGYNTHVDQTDVALYITEPPCGILPPWSTQEVVVTRVAREEAPELEAIQCKDKFFVWSTFVTNNVKATDITNLMPKSERKEVPVVFTETSSNELIRFEPPQLCIPLLPNQNVLSSAKIVNITDQYIGYRICDKKSNSARYKVNPSVGILPPLSTQVLLVTKTAEKKGLEDNQCKHEIFVYYGLVTEDVKASDVIDNMTEKKSTRLSIVLTKLSSLYKGSSTSDELIQFDPPELHFPLLPNKKVLSSFKIVNLTDYNVGFNTYSRPTNVAWYHTEPPSGILPPRSMQKLMITREEKEDALTKDKQLDDQYFVWKSIVSEGVKYSELCDCVADQESKELPIVLDKIRSSTSDDLIQLDPAELYIPLFLNKLMFFKVNVVNTTDFCIAFNVYIVERNVPRYEESLETGILPPRSAKKVILAWVTTETELENMEPQDDYFVWSRVVTEAVQSGDIISYMGEEESKHLPYILNKTKPCTSDELIRYDPPELSLPFMPNKELVFSVNIVNNTDYCVAFNSCQHYRNVGWYYIEPAGGVMQPRSNQRLVVLRIPKEKEEEYMQCQDRFYIWSSYVSEGVEVDDIVDHIDYAGSKELPIVYTKTTSLCPSGELIRFDPPQLPFPFLPNKRVSMLRFFKIVNITDHNVGFNIWEKESNSANYITEPEAGILAPQSTQAIKLRRTPKKEEAEDMQCKDKITVWTGIVTQGVEVSDLYTYGTLNKTQELPVVLTKPGGSSSR